jgi:hypothetical protein
MTRRAFHVVAACAGFAAFFCSRGAQAAEREAPHLHAPSPGSDGVYERLDGTLALAAGVGAEFEDSQARAALRLSAHYLWTAGIYARYADAFGTDHDSARAVSFGIDLRPLFLPRFGLDLEQGPPLLDLTLDSLALTAGAYFEEPRHGSLGDQRGFEMGVGLGVPFDLAKGFWLEGHAERRFADRGDNAWLFTVGVALHAITWSTEPRP